MSATFALSFWMIWLALATWFFFRNDEGKSRIFGALTLGALFFWVASWYMSETSWTIKMGMATRDLLILAGSGLFFLSMASKKARFWIGLIALGAIIYFLRQGVIPTPSAQQVSQDNIELDSEGEWLLELREDASIDILQPFTQSYGLSFRPAFQPASPEATELDDYYVVDIPAEYLSERETIKSKLMAGGAVDWIEANEVINVAPIEPSRKLPKVNGKFGVNDPELYQQWAMPALKADEFYRYLQTNKIKPKKKAKIAILDTGVDSQHEDLKGHYKSIRKKHDDDPRGHGTHCAGIAGAVTNNGRGIAGLARTEEFVEISSIKVLSAYGTGSQKSIIDGMIEAADAGVDIISMSLGGLSNQSKQRAYAKAVRYANKKGAIVVCAAGNSNRNASGYAPVSAPGVIGVSALDQNLNRAVFSNTVQDIEMGIAAPGVDIFSTIPGSKYKAYSGTSMATPYVAGLLGILRSLDPDMDTKTAHKILHESGQKTKDGNLTGRFIQPLQAVKMVVE